MTSDDRWGADTPRDRHVYCDDTYWYKVWGPDYLAKSGCFYGNQYKLLGDIKEPHGFAVGFFSENIASAFVSYIYDENEKVRGYVTRAGTMSQVIPNDFVEAVFNACVRSGWVFSDLGWKNVITVDGRPSLIDFDSHLASLAHLDLEFEEASGALRPHVAPRFRKLLRSYFDDQ
ncbi:hypothetical protein [uncultured Erythrobacter sp.]|uniref:hypothetical protein n=1 Tax=uncultured Erythrobacter sp. TaxID=263913 RepID=UPI00261F299C|nr:hypothetical protein [uncultured Erythrobacter sp.]